MSTISGVFRANPELIASTALFLAIPLMLALIALIMHSSGVSLRPIVFMAVLLMPLALFFVVVSLVRAKKPAAEMARSAVLQVQDGRFTQREKIFGAGMGSANPMDAKAVFPEFLGAAEHAELLLAGPESSVLAARFPSTQQAARAGNLLWKAFGVPGSGDSEMRNWRGFRPHHRDHIEMLRAGQCLFFWTAPTAEGAATRRTASLVALGFAEHSMATSEMMFPALQPFSALFSSKGMQIGGVLLLALLYSLWFFKGSAWASGLPPVAGVAPVPAAEVEARLLAINAEDVPFRIDPGNRPGEYFASWRYADAKWVDLARASGMQRTFRVRLTLDEPAHVVRATDYTGNYDWSAGAGGASIAWQAQSGIVFFQKEQSRVFGLQLDKQGGTTGELSYPYKFDLQELKAPLIAAITGSGWAWRPVVWQGPVWLRWFTE